MYLQIKIHSIKSVYAKSYRMVSFTGTSANPSVRPTYNFPDLGGFFPDLGDERKVLDDICWLVRLWVTSHLDSLHPTITNWVTATDILKRRGECVIAEKWLLQPLLRSVNHYGLVRLMIKISASSVLTQDVGILSNSLQFHQFPAHTIIETLGPSE